MLFIHAFSRIPGLFLWRQSRKWTTERLCIMSIKNGAKEEEWARILLFAMESNAHMRFLFFSSFYTMIKQNRFKKFQFEKNKSKVRFRSSGVIRSKYALKIFLGSCVYYITLENVRNRHRCFWKLDNFFIAKS